MDKKNVFQKNTNLVISEPMHDFILGTLLGDGHLASSQAGENWSYRCLQSEKQKDYLFHKYSFFEGWCLTQPKPQTFKGPKGQLLHRWYFNTRRMGILKPYGDLFYKTGETTPFRRVKRVPDNIQDLFTPRMIAYWFMDDGDQKWKGHSRGVRFSTNSFSVQECELLCDALREKYTLKPSLEKAGKSKQGVQQYRLYISSGSYSILKDLIWNHLVRSMRYKFPE